MMDDSIFMSEKSNMLTGEQFPFYLQRYDISIDIGYNKNNHYLIFKYAALYVS